MSIADKLFSFQGRLRRRDWWLFVVLLWFASAIVSGVAMAAMGVSLMSLLPMGAAGAGAAVSGAATKVFEVQCVVFLLLLWPGAALGVKRLHDRGKTPWLLAVFYVVEIAQQAISFITLQSGGNPMTSPTMLRALVSLMLVVVGIWVLIELGFLEGTMGPNKYGPSPKGFGAEEVGFTT